MRRLSISCLIAILAHSAASSYGQSDEKDKYQKWLNEEVIYIITAYERHNFLELKTDEEREKFIVAFWRKRGPYVETEENKSREQHYGRLAYANKNFAFGAVAGWRTDRGRIYILFGEPDEKVETASGEIWKYRYDPDIGEILEFKFADVSGTGDFRLVSQP